MTAFWDRMAPTYESDNAYIAGRELVERMRSAVADAVAAAGAPDGSPGYVVELGCGTGWFTRAYAPRCRRVLATDYSPAMLAHAARALAHLDQVATQQADATATGLPRGTADAVVVANVLDIVGDPRAVLVEAARLLRPGGVLVVVNFATEGMTVRQRLTGLYRLLRSWRLATGERRGHFVSRADLRALAASAGLTTHEDRLFTGPSMNALLLLAGKPG